MKHNLPAIRTFLAVAEEGGFRRAAARLGMAVATVSQHVAALEDELGVSLLDRTTRRVSLTRTGRAYFEECRRVFAQLDEICDSARSSFREPEDLLRISASNTFGREMVLPILLDFVKAHPSVHLDLVLTGRYVDLEAENIDLAIRIGRVLGTAAMAYRELPAISRLLCASPAYLATNGTPRMPMDLERHQCVVQTHRPQDHAWRLVDQAGAEHFAQVEIGRAHV